MATDQPARPGPHEWDMYRQEIKRLYVDEQWKLREIMDHFAATYQFHAT